MTETVDYMEEDDIPVLYVLMRSDVPDYVPGKAMAQANHAGTQFVANAGTVFLEGGRDSELAEMFKDWLTEGEGFGTCIVLNVTYPQLLARLALAQTCGFLNGIVRDLTYPVRDGHRMQALEVDTCGWVFGMKNDIDPLLSDLKLF